MLYGCVLLYITLIYIRPAEIVPGWAAIPFVDIVTVIAAIIGIFSLGVKPRPIANLPHDKFLLAFWAFIAISSAKVWMTGVVLSFIAFSPVIVCYFLIRAGVTTQRQLNGLLYLLVALNVFLAINGIMQYHTGIGLGNVTMKLDRIYGTGIFNDPNDLGLTFVLSVPLMLMMIARRRSSMLLRIPVVVALALVLVALYYTNSRGAIVGLAATMVCFSFFKFKPITASIAAVALVGLVAVAAPSRGGEISVGESSAQSRIQSWAEGWNMLKWHPITGVGYGQYTEHHDRVAHNSFVHTMAELGLLGAFALVGMFYWYFKGVRLIPVTDPDLEAWRRALMVSAAGMLTCGWFLSRQYVAIFYVVLAIGACAATLNVPRERLQPTQKDFLNIGGLTVFFLAFVYFSIRTMAVWGGG